MTIILSVLTLLSVVLLLWQFSAAVRFPLHQQIADATFTPAITILKPLKGATEHTADCLRSWLSLQYAGNVQVIFGVADEHDPVCDIVRGLLRDNPKADATLVIAPEQLGPNAKVSTLVQLAPHAKHELICVSDADVRVAEDFLPNAVAPLRAPDVGLVNCFYELANPKTLAMKWEAIAVNADFWSQVLQSNTLKRQYFALGAVMIMRREALREIGGFESLLEYLADDYELGHRIAATGARIELAPIVVQCWDKPMTFRDVWKHQLRWARTIRACQPLPYFFSVLSNVTLSGLLLIASGKMGHLPPDSMVYDGRAPAWLAAIVLFQTSNAAKVAFAVIAFRCLIAAKLQIRLTRHRDILRYWWLAPLKDLLQFGIWLAAFSDNTIEWRKNKFRVKRGGRLIPLS